MDIRLYRVIYDCINEIQDAMKGMLAPKFKESIIGHAEVRETYKVSKVGTVCGCYCTDGKIQRGCDVRVLRDNIVIHEGSLASRHPRGQPGLPAPFQGRRTRGGSRL